MGNNGVSAWDVLGLSSRAPDCCSSEKDIVNMLTAAVMKFELQLKIAQLALQNAQHNYDFARLYFDAAMGTAESARLSLEAAGIAAMLACGPGIVDPDAPCVAALAALRAAQSALIDARNGVRSALDHVIRTRSVLDQAREDLNTTQAFLDANVLLLSDAKARYDACLDEIF